MWQPIPLPKPLQGIRNVYCTHPEDKVVRWHCPCCRQCWLFVASRESRKNGTCPWGGPFAGHVAAEIT